MSPAQVTALTNAAANFSGGMQTVVANRQAYKASVLGQAVMRPWSS